MVVGRHELLVGVRDFQIVSEHAVEADFERRDARAGTLVRLDRGNGVLAAVTQGTQLVEFRVDPRCDRVFVADHQRWSFHQHVRESCGAIRTVIPFGQEQPQYAARGQVRRNMVANGARGVGDARQSRQRVTQGAEFAWRGPTGGGFACQSIDVAHTVECFAQRGAAHRIAHQGRHRIESLLDGQPVQERRQQPLSQQSLAHRGDRAIEYRQQRTRQLTAAQRFDQLEIAPRHFIKRHDATRPLDDRTCEMRESARLQFSEIPQQRARRADRRTVPVPETKPIQSTHIVLPRELIGRHLCVEFPRFALGHQRLIDRLARSRYWIVGRPAHQQQLARREAR